VALIVLQAACQGHEHDHADDDSQFICDGTEHAYAAGTEVAGADYKLRIVEADPVPHTVDLNTLRVAVLDSQDASVTGVVFDVIEPFAAKHDHGTPIVPEWSELGGGEYSITNLNYVHRGPWYLNFEITVAGMSDSMQFTFCISDPGFEDAGPDSGSGSG